MGAFVEVQLKTDEGSPAETTFILIRVCDFQDRALRANREVFSRWASAARHYEQCAASHHNARITNNAGSEGLAPRPIISTRTRASAIAPSNHHLAIGPNARS